MALAFREHKTVLGPWEIVLGTRDKPLVFFRPNQWGRVFSYSHYKECPPALWAAVRDVDLFSELKEQRRVTVERYPTGQRRFGTPGSQDRMRLCIALARDLNKGMADWLDQQTKAMIDRNEL